MQKNITINTRDRDALNDLADQAASVLSMQLGVHVTRHGALNAALRRGLADIVGVPVPIDNEPRNRAREKVQAPR